jgi:hypothetical protein
MGAPKENDNAEIWTIEKATEFMDEALELSKDKDFDFIGEIARELNQYKEVFSYLSTKFSELKNTHKKIVSNCEANCFYNGKKQNITPSLAIMNLKSNHGWTDRIDQTSKDKEISNTPTIVFKKFNNESDESE